MKVKSKKTVTLFGGPHNGKTVDYEGFNTLKMPVKKPGYIGSAIYEIMPSKGKGFFLENQWVIKI